MKIVHLTVLPMFLGGGERLAYNWVSNSIHESIHYSKEGGMDYARHPNFKTYKDLDELERIVEKHKDDLIVTHDAEIIRYEMLRKVKNLVWFIHGAFTFNLDLREAPQPKFAISNYLPENRPKQWPRIPVFPVRLGVEKAEFYPSENPLNGNMIVVGIVGRISDEKIPLNFWNPLR